MTLLIKGVEMPEDDYIDIRVFANGKATISTGEPPYFKMMEVVEIPTLHRRLIDADALKKNISEMYEYEHPTASGEFDKFAVFEVPKVIDNAPTIIEAEA